MNNAALHSAGILNIELFVGRFRLQRFVFSAASIDFDVSAFTWQLLVKTNPGDRLNVISLTLGNGLAFPIYEDNVIEARFEAATTNISEGDYYWQLVRTDTNEPWLNGKAKFSFGPLGQQGTAQEATINLVDQEVSVELSSIVDGSGSFSALTGNASDNSSLVTYVGAQAAAAQAAAQAASDPAGSAAAALVSANAYTNSLDAQRLLYKNNVSVTLTGTTAETLIDSYTVPIGTVLANDILKFEANILKSGSTSNIIRIRIGTTAGVGGTVVARMDLSSGNLWGMMDRRMVFKNSLASQVMFNMTVTFVSDLVNNSNAAIVQTIDFSVQQVISVTFQASASGDTQTLSSWFIESLRT